MRPNYFRSADQKAKVANSKAEKLQILPRKFIFGDTQLTQCYAYFFLSIIVNRRICVQQPVIFD